MFAIDDIGAARRGAAPTDRPKRAAYRRPRGCIGRGASIPRRRDATRCDATERLQSGDRPLVSSRRHRCFPSRFIIDRSLSILPGGGSSSSLVFVPSFSRPRPRQRVYVSHRRVSLSLSFSFSVSLRSLPVSLRFSLSRWSPLVTSKRARRTHADTLGRHVPTYLHTRRARRATLTRANRRRGEREFSARRERDRGNSRARRRRFLAARARERERKGKGDILSAFPLARRRSSLPSPPAPPTTVASSRARDAIAPPNGSQQERL